MIGRYSALEHYAKSFSVLTEDHKAIKAQCAFQLRIRPQSYLIGQETVGATAKGEIIDKDFNNNELEWYTKENVGIVVHRLLIKITQ